MRRRGRWSDLPVSLASLYDKVNHTEPGILRALVQGSAQRLAPLMARLAARAPALPGYALRVLDGNHLPGSDKRLAVLRGHRGAALPGQSIVVYDPDSGLVTDLIAGEDAHQSERTLALPVLQGARPGQVWIADRHFCTRTLLEGWEAAEACFIVREHAHHPRLASRGDWRDCGLHRHRPVHEQEIALEDGASIWRCVELRLDAPTEDGETTIRLWTNLPVSLSALHRWLRCIAGAGALKACSSAWRACCTARSPASAIPAPPCSALRCRCWPTTVLALISRCVEQAHQPPLAPSSKPPPEVSMFHLALSIKRGYEGMLIAVPPEHWTSLAPGRSHSRRRAAAAPRTPSRPQAARHQQAKTQACSNPKAMSMAKPPAPMSQPLASSHRHAHDPERGGPELGVCRECLAPFLRMRR